MSKLRVNCFSVSLDGFGAGPNQDLDNPLGVGGLDLHAWVMPTRTFQNMFGEGGGTTGLDDDFAARGFAVSPVLLGAGEHLLAGLNLRALGFERTDYVATPAAAHFVLTRR